MAIIVNLDMMLAKRKMTSLELANPGGHDARQPVHSENRQGQGCAHEHMDAICRELQCQPGDLFEFVQDDDPWKR